MDIFSLMNNKGVNALDINAMLVVSQNFNIDTFVLQLLVSNLCGIMLAGFRISSCL